MDCTAEGRIEDRATQSPLDYAEAVVVVLSRLNLDDGPPRIDLGKMKVDEAPYAGGIYSSPLIPEPA